MSDMRTAKYVLVHAEEWSALYIDGKLDKHGSTYLVNDRIQALLGVVEPDDVEEKDWLSNGEHPAHALETVWTNKLARNDREERALQMRAQAAALIESANQLDGTEPA